MIGKTILAAMVSVIAAPSAAAIYTLSAIGSISLNNTLRPDEFDRQGLFGPVGADLAGRPFALAFRIDTRLLQERAGKTPALVYYDSGFAATPPIEPNGITASIKIGGKSLGKIGQTTAPYATNGIVTRSTLNLQRPISYQFSQYLSINTVSAAGTPYTVYHVNGRAHPGLALGLNFNFGIQAPQTSQLLFDTGFRLVPFDIQVAPTDVSSYLSTYNSQTAKFNAFYFDITRVSLQAGSSVPEPASWSLLIVGFALTGTALRRRRASPPMLCRGQDLSNPCFVMP